MASDGPTPAPNLAKGYAAVGSEMVGFTLLGVLVDYLTHGWPWATAILTMVGVAVAVWHLSRLAKELGKPGGAAR
jgi:F0F1-type ATP synthase assembly protein I